MFMALELSRSTWLVAVHFPVADKVSLHRLDGGDTDGLLALVARERGRAEERPGRPARVPCCFEAGYDGFWLYRWLCAQAVENQVLDAAGVLVVLKARAGSSQRLRAARRRGTAWTGSPRGFDAVKKISPAFPASHLPTQVGCGSGTRRGPTRYKVVRHMAAQHIARPIPNPSSHHR